MDPFMSKGPKGTLQFQLPAGIHFKIENQMIVVERDEAISSSQCTLWTLSISVEEQRDRRN